MKLSSETEEVSTFYGRMLDHDYTTMETFNKNFFKDWKSVSLQVRHFKWSYQAFRKCFGLYWAFGLMDWWV